MPVLDIQKLTMQFGGLTAVSEFDYQVEPRKIFAIIGPNGAGKTTVFNAVTGIYAPTSGSIRFEGHGLTRPLTWKVITACIVVGMLTAFVAVLTVAGVDRLWYATIKRNMIDPTRPFTYAAAWSDFWAYLRSELALDRLRNRRWSVVTADSKKSLGVTATEAEAQALKTDLEGLLRASEGLDNLVEQRGDKWVVLSTDRARVIASFDLREDATNRLKEIEEIGRQQSKHRRDVWIGLLCGLVLGTAGAYAVWHRARRTPDVIALGGIARTFQNIRLFQNMTVLENVLLGMNRYFRTGPLRVILRTPGARKEEAARTQRALELLGFVGLAERSDNLAKNLPYGDQRRLEIARALATEPRLLLLDEPAAGMNPSEAVELMGLIRRIREQGVTVLLIEHHMNVVMGVSDRIAVLDHGVKIAEGTPQEVKCDPKVIEAYLGKEEAN